MTVRAVSATGVLLHVGGLWLLEVEVRDLDGALVDTDVPAVTVTLPDGSTASPAVENVTTGVYRAAYTATAGGRYVARAATTDDAVDFAAYVAGATTEAGMPIVGDVANYLRGTASSWTTEEMQDALDAEASAQRDKCGVRPVYPAALRQALLRRVQRNLAMRELPLAVMQGDPELGGGSMLPGRDPEVRRLERPYRRLVVG